MNSKCLGCGVVLQNHDKFSLGYISNNGNYCERCFRIKNYNEYQIVEKSTEEFYQIIDKINNVNDLVLLVVDVLSIGEELKKLCSKLKNKPLIVVSKRDVFSYKINDNKICNLVNLPYLDILTVSSTKNYNMDLLMEKIYKYKKSNKVYVVGLTNSGKSTLLNKIIYNYTDLNLNITTSMLPSTTLDTIEIDVKEDLTLIDTPGIVDNGNICNYLSVDSLKKLLIKKEIKPITYQVKCRQFILIEDFLKIECLEPCDMTLYFSNKLKIERIFKDKEVEFKKKIFELPKKCDLVINGLGYIAVNKETKINIYTFDNVEVYLRNK